MTDKPIPESREKRPVGGELVIPVAALVFTLYYFSTIIDSPWTAQVSAFFIGAILIALVLVFAVKSVARVRRGEADFGFAGLFDRTDVNSGRLWFFAITLAYVVLIEWGGFTLTTFGFLFASMLVLNKGRRPGFIGVLSLGFALSGYALFIVAFETRFPHGPFEWLMSSVM